MTTEEKIKVIKGLVQNTDFLETLSAIVIDNVYSKITTYQTLCEQRQRDREYAEYLRLKDKFGGA